MAKQTPPAPPGTPTTVNFVMLNVTGDATAIAKSIESLVQTMKHQTARPIAAATPARPALGASPIVAVDVAEETVAPTEEPAINAPGDMTPTVPAVQPKTPKTKRVFAIPKILDELNCEKGPMPFKEFVGARKIDSVIERGLYAVAYLRQHRGVETAVTTDHVHTCFSMLGWRLPDDPGSLLRSMKKAQLVRSVGEGLFELTSKGQNRFEELQTAT